MALGMARAPRPVRVKVRVASLCPLATAKRYPDARPEDDAEGNRTKSRANDDAQTNTERQYSVGVHFPAESSPRVVIEMFLARR